ncbi:MAG: hypothetical protein ABI868_26280 [Acidobacteriota bacterium]
MIDLRFVVAHGLWLLGAAVVLAAFSYHNWRARQQGRRRRDVLRAAPGWRMSVSGGALLAASGFLLMAGARWWEQAAWLLVWAGAAFDLWSARTTRLDDARASSRPAAHHRETS